MNAFANSILDDDLYKFTMQQAVLELHPDVDVEYRFTDRRPHKPYNKAFLRGLISDIERLAKLRLSDHEYAALPIMTPFMKPSYMEYL